MAKAILNSTTWFGRSRTQTQILLGLALIVCAVMFTLHTPSIAEILSPYGIPTGFGADFVLLITLMLLLAALSAYINNGILVSLILAGAPIFGITAASALSPYSSFNSISRLPIVLFAIILIGLVGYSLGLGVRKLTTAPS